MSGTNHMEKTENPAAEKETVSRNFIEQII